MLIDIGRNWTPGFHRFAMGAMVIYFFHASNIIPFHAVFPENPSETGLSTSSVVTLIAFVSGSSIIGLLVAPLGTLSAFNPAFKEERKIARAIAVGQTQNPILIEYCRDAEAKADLAKGLVGLVTFLVISIIAIVAFSWISGETNDLEPAQESFSWLPILGGFGAFLFGKWLRYSAVRSLLALDRALGIDSEENK